MGLRWRVVSVCVRGPLRCSLSRSALLKKLSLALLLCSLCLVFYYNHIATSNTSRSIDSRTFLAAVSSLQKISKHYSSVSRQNNVSGRVINFNLTHARFETHTQTGATTSSEVLSSPKYSQTFANQDTHTRPITDTQEMKNKVSNSQEKLRNSTNWRQHHVLLLYGPDCYKPSYEVKIFLEAHRIPFHQTNLAKGLQFLPNDATADRSGTTREPLVDFTLLVIVSDFHSRSLELYLDFCRGRNLPMVWIVIPTGSHSEDPRPQIPNLHTTTLKSEVVVQLRLSPKYPFHYGRPGAEGNDVPPNSLWTTFSLERSHDSHMTYGDTLANNSNSREPRVTGEREGGDSVSQFRTMVEVGVRSNNSYIEAAVILEDLGMSDGVRKVIMGTPVRSWLTHLILLDAVHVLCGGEVVRGGRERMVMVDIDDVFLAPEGRRMTPEDVEALLEKQEDLRQMVPGFTFNAGFVGGFYNSGHIEAEKLGNRELVRNSEQLWWFGHTYKHRQPHLMTSDQLHSSMERNREFAEEHGIRGSAHHYSVSPHHSGVYPVHPPLYEAWRKVWNISVTTTEEYPDLRPDHKRRGFKHRGISVLPRQTCRLFTHTFLYTHFKGGRGKLLSFARGGEVFLTLLRNPVSVFMTHTPNYCCDRLALSLLPALFQFTSHWTQLQLAAPGPQAMAQHYFSLFPEDKTPLWTSPCDLSRHREIWPEWMNCSRLPSLLILGPQKSGTTALHTFLSLHPQVVTNMRTELHFEEVQFFSDDQLYQRGIDWYMDQFPYPPTPPLTSPLTSPPFTPSHLPSSPSQPSLPTPSLSTPSPPPSPLVVFEKSATYLSHPLAPLRVRALLPRAQLVVILADPSFRAYSWYQHQRAHADPTSLQFNFSAVLWASSPSPSTPPLLTSLSHHCLSPGHYYQHISHWLDHFDHSQLLFVDGDELVETPAVTMDTILEFVNLPFHPYQNILQYDSRKGFYCIQSSHGRKHCLGKSKGRLYPPMTEKDQQWLDNYYAPHNTKLRTLLLRLGRTPPKWLLTSPPH